jgi:hypothetical protein
MSVFGFQLQTLCTTRSKMALDVELAFFYKAGSLTECKENDRLCTVDVSINRDRLSVEELWRLSRVASRIGCRLSREVF